MLKKICLALFFSCLLICSSIIAPSFANQNEMLQKFKDIDKGAWYLSPVFRLYKLGGVSGYSDNTFRPNQTITRAEFLTLLLATNDKRQEAYEYVWYGNYQHRAFELGLICPTDNFDLEQKITRLEMATLICKFLKLDTKVSDAQIFDDVRPTLETRKYMDTVYNHNLLKGYVEGPYRLFRPISHLTRAEASTAVINVYDYKTDKDSFLDGYSASSRSYETDTFYSFTTNIVGKNSSLFNITKIDARRHEEAFDIIIHLRRAKESQDNFKLDENHFQNQVQEVEDILSQQFSKEQTSKIVEYINKKQKPTLELELKTFESGTSSERKASVISDYFATLIVVTIWK